MRSVLVTIPDLRGWALDRLFAPLEKLDGVAVRYVNGDLGSTDGFEVVHASYFGHVTHSQVQPEKCIVSIHHLEPQNRDRIPAAMRTVRTVVAPYPGSFVALAQADCRVRFAPYWVATQPLSERKAEAVGLLGMRWATKRHEAIAAAAQRAGVPVVDWTRDPSDVSSVTGDLDEFYASVGVYVNASYCDAGPLPALDALARGIPVVTTPEGSVPMYLRDGENGLYTDGTVDDMAWAIEAALSLPAFVPPPMPSLTDWLHRHAEIYDAA